MDIRIDLIKKGPETVVGIAGRLAGNAVAELENACDQIQGSFVIDLSNLLFTDDEGINAIRTLADRGVWIHGASPFIQLLLDNGQRSKPNDEESTSLDHLDKGDTVKRCANHR